MHPDRYPDGFGGLFELLMLDEDSFLAASPATAYCPLPALARFRVVPERRAFELQWTRREEEFSVVGLGADRREVVLCGKGRDWWHLTLVEMESGCVVGSVRLPLKTEESLVKGVAYSKHLGVVVASGAATERNEGDGWVSFVVEEAPATVLLCDMASGVVVRTLRTDLAAHLGNAPTQQLRLWCDPPPGALLLTARGGGLGGGGGGGRMLLFDLRRLLAETREGETVTPDAVLEAGAALDGDAVTVSAHRLLFPGVDVDGGAVLTDLDCWGK